MPRQRRGRGDGTHEHVFTGSLGDQVFTCKMCGAYPEDVSPIPRLNRCPDCNTQDVPLTPLERDGRDLHRALHDLFFTFAEALRIDRLAGWLARRLP